MRWQVKCLVDSVKGTLPAQEKLRRLKRKLTGYRLEWMADQWTVEQGIKQVQWIQSSLDLSTASVLEIGSGWQPVIPMLFTLAGAKKVIMTDLRRLCHPESFTVALQVLQSHKQLILDRLQLPAAVFERVAKVDFLAGLAPALERLSIQYLAPCDVRKTGLPEGSVDAVVSYTVLEHIPPQTIGEIFSEMRRLLRPGGVMCHFVDNSDHWEHFDKTISRVNFLRYPDSVFRWTYLNGLNYQNRLRHPEYVKLLETTGFTIEREERNIDAQSRQILESFPVDRRFQVFSKDDLASLTSYFLTRKAQ